MNRSPIFYESETVKHYKTPISSVTKFLPILNDDRKIKYILLHETEDEDIY